MSQLSKQDLKAENQLSFPNNNNGAITPSDLRAFNVDMIDSTVNQTAFDSFSGSVASQFAAATGSVTSAITASSLITASFDNGTRNLTFTKGDASTFAVNIPDVSGSTLPSGVISGSSQITALGFVSSSVTASSLITASFSGNTLTFTKGDNSTFGVVIPDVSGSTINTGSFATTGSNSFVGNQSISGGLLISSSADSFGFSGSTFRVETVGGITFKPGTSIAFQGNTDFSNPGRFPILNVDNSGSNGYYGFNNEIEGRIYQDFSGSVNTRINNIVAGTGFATTGSNTFNGSQTVNGYVSASAGFRVGGSANALEIGDSSNIRFLTGSSNFYNIQLVPGVGDIAFSRDGASNIKTFTLAGAAGNNTTFQNNPVQFQGNVGFVQFQAPIEIQSGVNSNVDITGSLKISSTLTASLQEGYVWVGDGSGRTTTVATSSFGGGGTIDTGSFATTGSNTFTGNQTITTAGNTQLNIVSTDPVGQSNLYFQAFQSNFQAYGNFTINNNGQFGGSGSIKMVTSNNALDIAADNGIRIGATNGAGNGLDINYASLQVRSGSISLAPAGFTNTTASLTHISSSTAQNNVNLIFKSNNNTATTILSGSANIFTNAAAPTAGFVRYMTGGNIGVGGSGVAVPQISGSMAFSPTIANNYFGVSANPLTLRGPVSSSAYTINNNVLAGGALNLGTSAAFNFERAVVGLSLNGNLLAGNLNAIASKTNLSASVSITSNIIGGGVNLNMDSSSISFNGNSVQGTVNVNNSYFPATTGSQVQSQVNGGLFIGTSTIYASGSNTTFTGAPGRTVSNAVMLGANNVISASLNSDLAQVNSTALIGQGLVVVGSNSRIAGPSAADWGSVFVGRWNSDLGTSDMTGETIFAVGTGTGASTRKTGFLIDSGSNTFVEGTLNVSGSTRLSGSTFINNLQNGVTSNIVTYDTTTGELRKASLGDITSASFDAAEFWSTTTQSGSAGVSGSITFNNSGSVAGISVVNNSQITVSQAGTYNVQFSTQLETSAGADTVWVWFKKNGNNISDSASKAVLANNTAQIMTVNLFDEAVANDYYELAYQTLNGHATVLYEAASGNIPAIPSVILTINQIR